jgi:hypothetical protein
MVAVLLFFVFLFMIDADVIMHTKDSEIVELELNQMDDFTIKEGETISFCYEKAKFLELFRSPFATMHTDLVIEVVSIDSHPFPMFSVQSISSNDILYNLQIIASWGFPQFTPSTYRSGFPYYVKGLFRDFFYSYPHPFFDVFHPQDKVCTVRFSPDAKSCVRLQAPLARPIMVSIEVKEIYNTRYAILLAGGLLLLSVTNQLAKSKIFQVRLQ